MMAQKFGGRYSPSGAPVKPGAPDDSARPTFQMKRRSRAGGRVNLLFLAPLIFAVRAYGADPAGLVLNLAALGLLILAAWLTREGILAQEAYEARSIAKRPAVPRKLFAAVLTGAGLSAGGLAGGTGLVMALVLGGVGALVHVLAFGPDPMRDKGAEGIDPFQSDRVARAVDEGEKHLAAMKDAILRARDRQLELQVDRFAETARSLFRTVEGDPRDLTAARKDIGVFLKAARDATAKFADLYVQTRDARARADYEDLLADLDRHFKARTDALLSNDHTDLDVEIGVLRERLALEGPSALATGIAPDPVPDPIPVTPNSEKH
jgi:hypothetical protein